ncbi:MAG: hypothetical protein FWG03_04645 [Clostridiales bacterium]|nr:hypothetical protein [Clostridiales bacterium]
MRCWNISEIKKEITLYTIIAAAAVEAISLPILGPDILFTYGLAIGACAAVINLNIISVSVDRAVRQGRKGPVILGFVLRALLYGGAFWLAASTSGVCGVGAAAGFLLPRIVMPIRFVFLPWLRMKLGKEPETVYVTDTHSKVFVKEPWHVRYNKGRAYLTHRHYRKVRVVAGPTEADGSAGRRKAKGGHKAKD